MRRLLGTLVLVAAAIAALGYWRGWFDLTTKREGDRTNIGVTVHEDRIRADQKAAEKELSNIGKTVEKEIQDATTLPKEKGHN
jgi:hypothetical protein